MTRLRDLKIRNKIKNQEAVIINNALGNPRINPIYISDLLTVIKKVISKRGSFKINVAGKRDYSILEISEIIGELLNKKPIYKMTRNKEIGDLMGDISLMQNILRFSPKISLVEGLTKFLQ